MTKIVLILAANPENTNPLRLDQEVREIENGLERAQKREDFVLIPKWATRPKDVRRAMLDHKPNIVHFCGHGSGEEGIAFEDEDGQATLVSTEALSGFFELFSDKVACVVLNACYSEVQAEAIAKYIPYVVGMKKAIEDVTAIEFAVAFYDALGAGEPFEFAYKLACNAIQWSNIPDYLIPSLKSGLPKHEELKQKSPIPLSLARVSLATNDKEYGDYVEDIVRNLSISPNGKIYRDKEYIGVRQPGSYKIDISLEMNVDEVLSLLIIVDCKNWKSMVDRVTVQSLIQTRDAISAHKAICVSQFGFSEEAIEVAKAQGIGLWMFAKGQIKVYGGGGLSVMNIGKEMAEILSEFLHKELMYCGSYTNNLTYYGRPADHQVSPNLVPYEWIGTRQSLKAKSDVIPEYEVTLVSGN
jgi:hypothetical protein